MFNKGKYNLHEIIPLSCWGLLGVYRGINEIVYNHNKYNEKYNEKSTNKPYLYSQAIVNCVKPILVFAIIPKEIYRFEVCIRGLDSEKKMITTIFGNTINMLLILFVNCYFFCYITYYFTHIFITFFLIYSTHGITNNL